MSGTGSPDRMEYALSASVTARTLGWSSKAAGFTLMGVILALALRTMSDHVGVDPLAEAVALTGELVAIDSVNPSLAPGAAGEREIVAHLERRLSRAGFATHVIRAPGHLDRPSLVAIPPGPPDHPTVILNGHLDTVPVAGMADPFAARIEAGRLYGRGAADMKGGVAALVVAAEHLHATGAPVRAVLALVADEEDASIGSEAVIAVLPELGIAPEVCVIAEPTGLALARSLRGFAVVRAVLAGVAAHSSQPELGVNAVTQLGRLLAAIDAHAASVRANGGDLMVTTASGGDAPFVIPDRAECLIERRTVPGEQADLAVEEVRTLLDPDWDIRLTLIAHREAWRLADSGAAAALAKGLGAALGTAADFDAPYWMEAPLWEQVCPTVVCGPSGGGLHADVEWLEVEEVRAFTCALIDVLADPRPWSSRAD